MQEELNKILADLKSEIEAAKTSGGCEAARVKYLGKSGLITEMLKALKDVPPAEKPRAGALINAAKTDAESIIGARQSVLKSAELNEKLLNEKIDVTLNKFNSRPRGNLHPLSYDINRVCSIMTSLGFTQVDGPEVEYDKYNFELLNIPKGHPARDMQDSFYITDEILLRTQTSNTQARSIPVLKPPFRIFSPGRCFRQDNLDATHSPAFYQFECLVVEEKASMADLKNTLLLVARELLGEDTEISFRASFFPFTEPSVEVDATCNICKGKGCAACKNNGYIELLGAGMVHPKVLEMGGIDSTKFSGYAFGMGIDRMSKLSHKIPDLRYLYENDVRFLRQFK